MDDRQLIHEFVERGSENAFRELLSRHLGLVHSTALRLLHDSQLAQEVSQAVFMLLARKAGSFNDETVLTGWLYRTTRFVAARAGRAEQRRQKREQEAFEMQQISSSDETWQGLEPVLDEAMDQLGNRDRDAVLLRYFQEEPLRVVGDKLGISEEAARKRVDRSLDKLRAFFARRGIHVTAPVLGTLMASHSAKAAPASLYGSIAAAVVSQAATNAAMPALVAETLSAWTRAKTMRLAFSAAGVLMGLPLIYTLATGSPGAPQGGPAAGGAKGRIMALRSASPAGSATQAPATERNLTFAFRAVDADTGRGLANAKVVAMCAEDPQHMQLQTNLFTDSEGRCAVPFVFPNIRMLVIGVLADGYLEKSVFLGGPEPLPSSYSLALPRGSTIGGVVLDETGSPVAGAGIQIGFYGTGDSSNREFQRERPGFPTDDFFVARTDTTGRWRFASAPETGGNFWVEVRKPGFPAVTFRTDADEHNFNTGEPRLKLDELRTQTAALVLKSGLVARGIVTNERRSPVEGATVRFGAFFSSGSPTLTAADGSFSVSGLASGPTYITVAAEGFAPERFKVDLGENAAPLTITLKQGAWLRVRVTDESGKGVSHTDVRLQAWRGNNSLEWGGPTDDDGRVEWRSAPHDEMNIFAGKEGFFYSRNNLLTADGEEHAIMLNKQLTVSGYVMDAETRDPIATFKVVPGSVRHDLVYGTNGFYTVSFREYEPPFQVRFEAEGYELALSPPLTPGERPVTYDAALQKQRPQDAVRGIVLQPNGEPAAEAQVALVTAEKGAILGAGKFLQRADSIVTQTDAQGRFAFKPDPNPRQVIAVNEQGVALAETGATNRQASLQLQPWGRIEGHLTLRGRSSAAQQIALMCAPVPNARPRLSLDLGAFSVKTDQQGDFIFEQVPPGEFVLYRVPGPGIAFTHQTPVQIQPGSTIQAQLGGTGTMLKGRFTSPNDTKIDWPQQMRFAYLSTKLPPLAIPRGLGKEELAKWQEDFWSSAEGRARAKASRSYPVIIDPDGSFTVDDVPPGTYELRAMLTDPRANFERVPTGRPIGSVQKDILVPEPPAGSATGSIDLGNIPLEKK